LGKNGNTTRPPKGKEFNLMTYDEWAAIGHANAWLGVRRNHSATSGAGAKAITVRSGSQRATLLASYYVHDDLTDEEAGKVSGLSDLPKCCYWKRCGELRQAGYIKITGATRVSSAGVEQQVCAITDDGIKALADLA
jgi:hypothetical protein